MRSLLSTRAARGAAGALLVSAGLPLAAAQGVAPGAPSAGRPGAFSVELFGVQGQRGDARLPGESSAARFALDALVGAAGAGAASRVEAVWPLGERGELRGLAARPALAGEAPWPAMGLPPAQSLGALPDPAAGAAGARRLDLYRIDDYRLTWRYALLDSPQLAVKLGVTARLRDARATLRPGAAGIGATDPDLLPLLHASVERPFGNRLSFVADIDALALPQGHALDAGLRLRYALDRDWSASMSYRILDGTAGGALPPGAGRLQYFGVGVRRAF